MQLLLNAISALYKWLKQLWKNPWPALCNCCLMQYWHYTNDSKSWKKMSACIMRLLLHAIMALNKWLEQLGKNLRPALCNYCFMQCWHYTNDSKCWRRKVGLHCAIFASRNIGIIQMTQTARKESSACIMQLLLHAILALYKGLKQLGKNPRPALCNCCLMQYRHYTNDSNS